MRKLLCWLGAHDWKSTYAGHIPGQAGRGWLVHPRDLYENHCRRCGTLSPLSWRLEKEESADRG